MTNIFAYLISHKMISSLTLTLLLLLPVITLLTAFIRQVIGINIFGGFAIIIATYAFLGSGLIPGIIISLIIFISSILLRISTKALKIHYLPRISLLITFVTIIIIVLIPLSTFIPILNISNIPGYSAILFITLSDTYITAEIQKGYKEASKLFIQTIIVSLIIYLIVKWKELQLLLLNYPELLILFLILNLVIGRWKALRVTELYRFKTIIREKGKDYV